MAVSKSRNHPKTPIYLDHQATTPTDPRVVQAMLPYFTERFGNPHSVHHAFGEVAAAAVEEARGQLAELLGADPREIVFTSGATESNNLAIKGVARFRKTERPHLVTLATEHKCVLESMHRMEREGHEVTVVPVESDGRVDPGKLAQAVSERTALVSVMAVNNEIGVIQPIPEIAEICHAKGAYLHCDAAQAVGKLNIDVRAWDVDLLSVSGHKFYGPKGIGALFVRRRPRVRLTAEMDGGAQERGFRSGTLPTPLCVGLGEAARIALCERDAEWARLVRLKNRFLSGLSQKLEGFKLNGAATARYPGNINVSIQGVRAEALIAAVPELAVSTGSACTSSSVEPSYVLRALGLSSEEAASSLRLGLGRWTSEAEVDFAVERIAQEADRLRRETSQAAE